MTATKALQVRALAPDAGSPEHKRFRKLLAQIDEARERLGHWQEQLPWFAQAHQEQVKPLDDALFADRRAWAFELEQIVLQGRWSKIDSKTLAAMLCDLSGSLLEGPLADDAELKALHDRHADVDYDTQDQEHLSLMKSMVEAATGVELGDAPAASMDELMQQAREAMAREAQAAAHGAPDAAPWLQHEQRRKKKAPSAAEKRAEADAQRVSQTVREVYRKLATALHPDRVAPDATAEERAERTAQMARANAANDRGDLLELLSLQLEIEQLKPDEASALDTAQVRHFNKVLAEQLRELQSESDARQAALCEAYGYMPDRRLDPLKLGVLIKLELQELEEARLDLQREQRALRGDTAGAKRWLKRERAQQREDDFYF